MLSCHLWAALEKLLKPSACAKAAEASEEAVSRWAAARLHAICSVSGAVIHTARRSELVPLTPRGAEVLETRTLPYRLL